MKRFSPLLLVSLMPWGCAVGGQAEVELDLEVVGTRSERVTLADGGVVRLERADLAFGPLTLCPGAQAGALCDHARLEWLDAARVDTLSPEVRRVGSLVGVTGGVRSFMYDLGIVSLLGEPGTNWVTEAARALGSSSLWLAGQAELDAGLIVPFSARIVVKSEQDNEQGIPVVRKSSREDFAYEITEESSALRVSFDPGVWLSGLRSTDFVQEAECSAPRTRVCQGQLELSCDASGKEEARRDCRALDQFCAPQRGCARQVEMTAETAAYRALVLALTAGTRPRFELR